MAAIYQDQTQTRRRQSNTDGSTVDTSQQGGSTNGQDTSATNTNSQSQDQSGLQWDAATNSWVDPTTVAARLGASTTNSGTAATTATDSSTTTQSDTSAALNGWDQTKWNDPTVTSTKYVVGRILAKYPATTAGLAQAWNEIKAKYPNATFDGKDSITGLPGTLGPVDVLTNASNGGSSWWWGDQGAMTTGTTGSTTGHTTGSTGSTSGSTSGTNSDYSDLYNLLMQRAKQSLEVNPNDPIIKGQTDAFRATQDRGIRDYLSQSAEKGGNNSNLGASTRSAYEHAGQNTAAMQSQLMQNELNSRRTEIQNALSESGSLLTAHDQLALQRELGLINAEIQRLSVNNQFNLGQQQITSNNDQFMARFGLDSTNLANLWDWIRRHGTTP